MIEAMACVTPVIAFRAGSVPEVVEEGVTGFIVDDEEQAIRAVNDLGRLDRRVVRARFEERFAASRMAKEYECRYRELLDRGGREVFERGQPDLAPHPVRLSGLLVELPIRRLTWRPFFPRRRLFFS
jgi:hypothetical protein